MEHPPTLHSILDKYELRTYDVKAIKQFLTQNSSSINEVCNGYQPLHRVLRSRHCSKELVRLLLDYGADVNPSHNCSKSQLQNALLYVYDTSILRMLLERGADVDRIIDDYCSLLSFALHRRDCNKEEVQMLLDFAKSPKSWCQDHKSLLQCYIHKNKYLHASVVELLISKSTDLGNPHPFGRSTLCHALRNGDCKPVFIKLLLTAGTHISKCDSHLSPLHCYVYSKTHLSADIVKLLLEKGTDFKNVSDDGNTLLHFILGHCSYEVAALEILLENKDVDVNLKNESGCSPLICALSNIHYFMPEAVPLLINKGARLDDADSRGFIPLHYAVKLHISATSLVSILIDNGSPLDVKNSMGLTPLEFALTRNSKSSVIKLLLLAGARLHERVWAGISTMAINIIQFGSILKDQIKCLELLLRHAILENASSTFNDMLIVRQVGYFQFMKECIEERQQMSSTYISPDVTLLEFATRYPCAKLPNLDPREYDFNELLRILANKAFPIYFEIILTKVKRSYMENKLQELMKDVVISSCDPTCVEPKIVDLNVHCASHIASFLPEKDFLNFIIALIPK